MHETNISSYTYCLSGEAVERNSAKMSHAANIASLDLLIMLGKKSKQNLPHGGEKWGFTMVESVKITFNKSKHHMSLFSMVNPLIIRFHQGFHQIMRRFVEES